MTSPTQHRARKRFGQNFLRDQGIIDRIVSAINPKPHDSLVEIGPGQGALTEPLLAGCPRLQVVELDRDLVPQLTVAFAPRYPDFRIHQADALKVDFTQFVKADSPGLRIVGNLPYNISTPLIFHLLSFHDSVVDMHFMLQKEVVERLAAGPGEKNYGRLGIMVQYYCDVDNLFEVPPECFSPRPKVTSAVVRLRPRSPIHPARNVAKLEEVVRLAFQQRRKTLRNALRQLMTAEAIADVGIDPMARPEVLSLSDFVRLSDTLP